MAERMTSLGEDIQINAPALQFVPAARSGASGAALSYLDELASLGPLPPARFIDRTRHIHAPSQVTRP